MELMLVHECNGELIVKSGDFCAVYYKPDGQPQLILRRRTPTEDHALLARAWQAANDKARELDGLCRIPEAR
jgi:hypothetical protein